MKKKISLATKILALGCCTAITLTSLAGCFSRTAGNKDYVIEENDTVFSQEIEPTDIPSEVYWSDGVNDQGLYDSSILYRNDMSFPDAPDPGVIYDNGYYYVFHTAAPIKCYRTQNFANWELVSYAFDPSDDSWAYGNYWAPEVIKSKSDGKYYMYYNASCTGSIEGVSNPGTVTDRMKLGVAVSDKVEGPYKECRDSNGKCIVFDIAKSSWGQNYLSGTSAKVWACIDAHPFYDGDQLYLYMAKCADANFSGNEIWGMKMNSMTEPDYNTLTQITEYGKKTPGGSSISYESGSNINEGPYMIKHTSSNGKTMYYMAFSAFGYTDRRYSVCIATSTSPLGTFTKLDTQLLYLDATYDHVSGTGHNSFVEVNGQLYIFYHGHKDVEVPSGTRGVAVDRITWVYDSSLGYDVMHANGPTRSLQLTPYEFNGYENITKEGTMTLTNVTSGDTSLLTDDIITFHTAKDDGREVKVTDSGTTVKITFPSQMQVRAIMVHNSCQYEQAFAQISNIKLTNANGTVTISDAIPFPTDYYSKGSAIIRPGGACFIQFTDFMTNSIEFTVSGKLSTSGALAGIGLSEIVVVGKTSGGTGV